MQLIKMLPRLKCNDYWEERADKVLSHFHFRYPDEIDMYEICWRYGIKIKPLDEHYCDVLVDGDTKAFSIPQNTGRRGTIYLKPDLDAIEKKLLLAEEFCHLYAHHRNQLTAHKNEINKMENQAYRMSAYLLMPQSFFKEIYIAADDQPVTISEIADFFLVTEQFAQYRLKLIFDRKVDAIATIKGKLGTLGFWE